MLRRVAAGGMLAVTQFSAGGADTVGARLLRDDPAHRFMMVSRNAGVVLSENAGGFFCSAAFYVVNRAARAEGSPIQRNGEGHALGAFLHVPLDHQSEGAHVARGGADRFKDLRTIVGLSIRGFALEARDALALAQKPHDAVRILLTGFDNSGAITNNPTGAFVTSAAELTGAIKQTFVLAAEPERIEVGRDRVRVVYTVAEPSLPRTIEVEMARLKVADSAIDGGDKSLQARIAGFAPHAVVAMGADIRSTTNYSVEIKAEDLNLKPHGAGFRYRTGIDTTDAMPNLALYRALVRVLPPAP